MTAEKMGELMIDSQYQLYLIAKSILFKDEDCADDISEMIVKVFSKLDTLREERYAKTWMIRILLNECYRILERVDGSENALIKIEP